MPSELAAEFANPFSPTPFAIVVLRMMLALVFGGLIGWERHLHAKPAGARTHMLIALAACLAMLLALAMIETVGADSPAVKFDPLRLIAAVTSGVAFLSAGVIITTGGHVHGLTTGAGMWLAGVVGLAVGAGHIPLAAVATGFALIVLEVMRRFERNGPPPG